MRKVSSLDAIISRSWGKRLRKLVRTEDASNIRLEGTRGSVSAPKRTLTTDRLGSKASFRRPVSELALSAKTGPSPCRVRALKLPLAHYAKLMTMIVMLTGNLPFLLYVTSGGVALIPFVASKLVLKTRKFWGVTLGLAVAAVALNVAIALADQSNPANNVRLRFWHLPVR
jgi:hypothetical protein